MGARWDDPTKPDWWFTLRGGVVVLIGALLLMWAAAALGTWLTGTPDPVAARVGEGTAVMDDAWVSPLPIASAAGGVTRGSSPAARASRSHHHLPPVLLRIRHCESHDNYRAENRHSTASGAWQILDGTWARYGGYHHASHAPRDIQDAKALALYLDRGTKPWRASRRCWS